MFAKQQRAKLTKNESPLPNKCNTDFAACYHGGHTSMGNGNHGFADNTGENYFLKKSGVYYFKKRCMVSICLLVVVFIRSLIESQALSFNIESGKTMEMKNE